MRNLIYTYLFFCLITSCNVEQKQNLDNENYLKLISNKTYIPFIVVVKANVKDKLVNICITNTSLYNEVFLKYYKTKFHNYFSFLTQYTINDYYLEERTLNQTAFSIIEEETEIFKEYKSNGFDMIKQKYLVYKTNKLTLMSGLSYSEKLALIKIMFGHQYYIIQDDYSGLDYIFFKKFDNKH
ncbi:hypothetical protein Q0590_32725 [Rhodocytophaga aerolata]|uniref:Lipoprotein n=1 Tax=Rhodocytophaga aerolata TaxID=455078 RepID=A0ABT8RG47_9BACT|nr:hypothetical protein [Rhodocytophaga aerolata]MDO1451085.1 hypothetical protein [Rhodocytophaga aerolata]